MPMPLTWEEIEQDFEPDGALRDIYVLDAGLDVWRVFLRMILDAWPTEFTVDGTPSTFPADIADVFSLRGSQGPLLQVRLGTEVVLNCHFFSEETIELDLDPREVGPENYVFLEDFLLRVGRTLQREVVLTHENIVIAVIARYNPAKDEVSFVPAAASN